MCSMVGFWAGPRLLVIFYSLHGNTRFIAARIAAAGRGDLLVLQPKLLAKPPGLLRPAKDAQILMGDKPALLPFRKAPEEYDLLIIGTPVWGLSCAPPLRFFLADQNLRRKKIALFCCHSGRPGEAIAQMTSGLAGNTILGEASFCEPLQNRRSSAKQAAAWYQEILVRI